MDTSVELMITDACDIYSGSVEDWGNFRALCETRERRGGEGVAGEEDEGGPFVGSDCSTDGGYKTRGAADGLAGGYVDVVHVVAGDGWVG